MFTNIQKNVSNIHSDAKNILHIEGARKKSIMYAQIFTVPYTILYLQSKDLYQL